MYNAGQADAKTGSVDTGVSEMGSASTEGSQGVNPAAETVVKSAAETKSGSNTEQPGTATTQKSGSEVNPELEEKLGLFKLNSEERTGQRNTPEPENPMHSLISLIEIQLVEL